MRQQPFASTALGSSPGCVPSRLLCNPHSPIAWQVTAGSGDRCVYIWNTTTRALMYKLPGHSGSVNECVFHPKEPIIGSASSDKTIYLGELAQ